MNRDKLHYKMMHRSCMKKYGIYLYISMFMIGLHTVEYIYLSSKTEEAGADKNPLNAKRLALRSTHQDDPTLGQNETHSRQSLRVPPNGNLEAPPNQVHGALPTQKPNPVKPGPRVSLKAIEEDSVRKAHNGSSREVGERGAPLRNVQQVEDTELESGATNTHSAGFSEASTKCRFGLCYTDYLNITTPRFLKEYRNPCWYQERVTLESQTIRGNAITWLTKVNKLPDGGPLFLKQIKETWQRRKTSSQPQFRCLPYFTIIGQAKSGSTDLYARLRLHPQIVLSPLKEPQWHTWKRFYQKDGEAGKRFAYKYQQESPLDDYISVFDVVAEQIQYQPKSVTGDGSSNLFSWNYDWEFLEETQPTLNNTKEFLPRYTIADYLKATNPSVKCLLILRDPTERLFSAYKYFPHPHSPTKNGTDFHDDVVHDVELFRKCRRERNSRSCVYDKGLRLSLRLDLVTGFYSVFLQDWMRIFGADQLKVLNFEYYKENTEEVLGEIISFLKLAPLTPDLTSIMANQATQQVNPANIGNMLSSTRELLNRFYRPYNRQLVELTEDATFDMFGGDKAAPAIQNKT